MVRALEHMLVLGVVMIAVGIVAGFLFDAYEAVQQMRRHRRRRARAEYERYAAEQAIRNTRRHAIQGMLAAEREYRDLGGSGEIIEGTAVDIEVRRP